MKLLPLMIIPFSVAIYHMASKTLGGKLGNPWAILALTYVLAALLSLGLALVLPGYGVLRVSDIRSVLPLALLLGLACVGIEGGYLLAYRLGWQVNVLVSITSFIGTLGIFSVGFLFFKEAMTSSSVFGLVLVLMGVVLVNWK